MRILMESRYGLNDTLGTVAAAIPVAYTATGAFIGTDTLDVLVFKGIPYAAQPVGELRWKAPVPLPVDSGSIYQALYFGHSALQATSHTQPASYYPQGEDCLTLNVWTTDTDTLARHPVMVWIHGGSYGWGGTSDPLFDGFNLVHNHPDIVMVSINYRLGILGFMDFSSFSDGYKYPDAPDLGLLDQIAALKWIRTNIGAFGGDRDNITIFGESAGAGSVALLTVAQPAKGLFGKAIMQSGSMALTSDSAAYARLAAKIKKKTGATTVAQLAAFDYGQIKSLSDALNDDNCFPMRGGSLIPADPYRAISDIDSCNLDILIGTNADEVRYWIDGQGGMIPYTAGLNIWSDNIYKSLPDSEKAHVDRFEQLLSREKNVLRKTEFFNDLFFRIPAITMADAYADSGCRTFVYYWRLPSLVKPERGACHTADLPYVFGNFFRCRDVTSADSAASRLIMKMWTDFARTGDPSVPGIRWEPYKSGSRAELMIADSLCIRHDYMGDRRQLISSLMHHYISPLYGEMSLNVPFVYYTLAIIIIAVVIIVAIIIIIRCRKR